MINTEEKEEYKKYLELEFFGCLAEDHVGLGFTCNGREYWISTLLCDVPPEFHNGYEFFQTTGHNDDINTKFIRAFKDKFDLFENFIIDGKSLRQHVFDADVEIIDINL